MKTAKEVLDLVRNLLTVAKEKGYQDFLADVSEIQKRLFDLELDLNDLEHENRTMQRDIAAVRTWNIGLQKLLADAEVEKAALAEYAERREYEQS